MALTSPSSSGYPFTTWPLRKLRDSIVEKSIVADISVSNLQKILKDEELTYLAVKTWKQSDDPDSSSNMALLKHFCLPPSFSPGQQVRKKVISLFIQRTGRRRKGQ